MSILHRRPHQAWRLAAALLLLAAAAAPAQQRVPQFAEDHVVVRALPAAAAPAQLCVAGARWLRITFQLLELRGRDRLLLASSDGDRLQFAGNLWHRRSFTTRALRGGCVDFAAGFSDPGSRYRVAGYQAGSIALESSTARVAGAGDLCDSTPADCGKTSELVIATDPTMALVLGDNAYASGTLAEYLTRYDPYWGRFKALTAPVPGNHEYQTTGASGYFDYFNGVGNPTGPAGDRSAGYYSYDVGEWHFIALNSRGGGTVSSAQLAWLDADLRANTKPCTAAYWHHPLVSRGSYSGYATMKPIFDRLYASRADLALVGHDHNYQRYAPMDGGQSAQADGVRQLVVGTGGADLSPVGGTHPLLEVKQGKAWGVLRLTLGSAGYSADFVPVAGQTWSDSFSGTCHRAVAVVPDFLLWTSASIAVVQGQSGGKLITVASYGGFSAPVALDVTGLPSGVTASLSANPVTPPPDGNATPRLVLRASASATPGTFTVTVSGSSGAFVRRTSFRLIVKSP